MHQNGQPFILKELNWLGDVLTTRIHLHFGHDQSIKDVYAIQPPETTADNSFYSEYIRQHALGFAERVVLILALAPHVKPDFFDLLFNDVLREQGDFPQIGGVRGKHYRGFLPTGETALFLLAGADIEQRFKLQILFDVDHFFHKNQILSLAEGTDHEPLMSGRLIIETEYIELFTIGKVSRPRLSASFPAQHITTELQWSDLVLNDTTLLQIKDIENWVKYNDTLLNDWNMKSKIKPGYRCLFHGPPGTGKTLTATLLGKYTHRDVFRVDLSTVVSKYIGETEKNLSTLFNKAQSKDWILFFDEADALFGKRTNVRDAHDKYANQEVSYLLQRIENHPGLVILASNFKSNIDEAFTRRFQSLIYFPMPNAIERRQLWEKTLPERVTLDKGVNIESIAKDYELSGANIVNIVQYFSLKALSNNSHIVNYSDIMEGIKKEYTKEGKLF